MAVTTLLRADVSRFSASDAQQVREWVNQSRALARAIALALTAQEDRAVTYDDNQAAHWGAAIELVISKLTDVRGVLLDRVNAPTVDWFTPLNAMEALGAATWHAAGSDRVAETLSFQDARHVLACVGECLDRLENEMGAA